MSFEFVSYFVYRASNLHFCLTFAARPVKYRHRCDTNAPAVRIFHGASPVEYRLDQDRVVHPKRYSTGQRAPRKEKKNSKHEIRNTKQIQMT